MIGDTVRLTKDYEIVSVTKDDIQGVAALITASWRFAYRGIIDTAYLDALGEGQRRVGTLRHDLSGGH
jgi:nitrogen fixation protein